MSTAKSGKQPNRQPELSNDLAATLGDPPMPASLADQLRSLDRSVERPAERTSAGAGHDAIRQPTPKPTPKPTTQSPPGEPGEEESLRRTISRHTDVTPKRTQLNVKVTLPTAKLLRSYVMTKKARGQLDYAMQDVVEESLLLFFEQQGVRDEVESMGLAA